MAKQDAKAKQDKGTKSSFYTQLANCPEKDLPHGGQVLRISLIEHDLVEYTVHVGGSASPAEFGLTWQEDVIIAVSKEAKKNGVILGSRIILIGNVQVLSQEQLGVEWAKQKEMGGGFSIVLKRSALASAPGAKKKVGKEENNAAGSDTNTANNNETSEKNQSTVKKELAVGEEEKAAADGRSENNEETANADEKPPVLSDDEKKQRVKSEFDHSSSSSPPLTTQQLITETSEHYLIYEALGGKRARKMALDPGRRHLKLLPWAGVASLVSKSVRQYGKLIILGDEPPARARDVETVEGRAFCFLPLPCFTGLPVHINGYFELSANRRDIWWGSDMAGDGALRSQWNRVILEDIVAFIYCEMLLEVIKYSGCARADEVFSLLPVTSTSEAWEVTVQKIFINLCTTPVLHDPQSKRWIQPCECVLFDNGNETHAKILSILDLHPRVRGAKVIPVPSAIFNRLEETKKIQTISPGLLRKWIQDAKLTSPQTGNRWKPEWKDGIFLLQYCMSDITDGGDNIGGGVGVGVGVGVGALIGLPLIPLHDQTFAVFTDNPKHADHREGKFYLASAPDKKIFGSLTHLIVSDGLPRHLEERFAAVVKTKRLNVCRITESVACSFIELLLPDTWQDAQAVKWDKSCAEDTKLISPEWLAKVWRYLGDVKEISLFSKLSKPFVPTMNNRICLLSRSCCLVEPTGLTESVVSIMTKLGCHCIDLSIIGMTNKQILPFIFESTAQGVLECIKTKLKVSAEGRASAVYPQFESPDITAGEKESLRTYICKHALNGITLNLSSDAKNFLSRLPIFESYGTKSGGQVFVSLAEQKFRPPHGALVELLQRDFIKCRVASDEDLMESLGVLQMTEIDFYSKYVLGQLASLEPVIRNKAIIQLLSNLSRLGSTPGGSTLKNKLKTIKILPNREKTLCFVSEMYDPEVRTSIIQRCNFILLFFLLILT